jgi:hypothetical protein
MHWYHLVSQIERKGDISSELGEFGGMKRNIPDSRTYPWNEGELGSQSAQFPLFFSVRESIHPVMKD